MKTIAERHNAILELIKSKGYVKVKELSEMLGVSEVTIRKDLKRLENKKLLYRTHGSASHINTLTIDKHIDEKEKLYKEEKSRIAKAAVKLIEPNDKIIIASGTTLLNFAGEISNDIPLTVTTASVKVSLSLCYYPNVEVIQLGGVIRKNSVSVVGNFTDNMLKHLSFNKLFLGVDGLDPESGLTTSDMNEAYLNTMMIKASKEVIVLTDSSKFATSGFCKICDLEDIDHIITDTNAPAEVIEAIREKGIEVTLV